MAVFSTLISTSFMPAFGTGTSSIQMPSRGSRLTRARIVSAVMLILSCPISPIGIPSLYHPFAAGRPQTDLSLAAGDRLAFGHAGRDPAKRDPPRADHPNA